MPARVVVFIDGQNLYHSLREINLRENDIDFKKLFDAAMSPDDELVSTYLFRPEKLQEIYIDKKIITSNLIDRLYGEDEAKKIRGNLNSLPEALAKQVKTEFDLMFAWYKHQKQRFSVIDYKYRKISKQYPNFHIYRQGILRVDPYQSKILGEKGVDTALSVKLVEMSLKGDLDKIILFSGDSDHAEAVKAAKRSGKQICITKMHKGDPPINICSSKDLLGLAHNVFDIHEKDFQGKFKRETVAAPKSA